ncbi:hypothetical protein HDE_05652 [Halotydeus destructor]|nr:hypothetical protein HDE_05652 [Halotydeus destructor]
MRLLLLTGLLHVVLSVQVISDEDGSTTETAAHADANTAAQATQDGGSFAPTINADGHMVGANGRKIKRIVITRKHKKPANQSFDAQYEVVSQSRKETKINDKETEITETITTSDGRTITKKIRKKRIPAPVGQSQTVHHPVPKRWPRLWPSQ